MFRIDWWEIPFFFVLYIICLCLLGRNAPFADNVTVVRLMRSCSAFSSHAGLTLTTGAISADRLLQYLCCRSKGLSQYHSRPCNATKHATMTPAASFSDQQADTDKMKAVKFLLRFLTKNRKKKKERTQKFRLKVSDQELSRSVLKRHAIMPPVADSCWAG